MVAVRQQFVTNISGFCFTELDTASTVSTAGSVGIDLAPGPIAAAWHVQLVTVADTRVIRRVQHQPGVSGDVFTRHHVGCGSLLDAEETLETDENARGLQWCVCIAGAGARQVATPTERVVDATAEVVAVLLELLREDGVEERVRTTVEWQHKDREDLQ